VTGERGWRGDGLDVLHRAAELSRRGEEFALASVVWRQGPSSGQPGARAVITAAGQLYGWIGGACAEPVVIREAQRVIAERKAKLLLLGAADQFGLLDQSGAGVPDGMVAVAISCQSEGAMQVYIEPVIPSPHLTIVGRSPMAHTLADLARALGWRADVRDGPDLSAATLGTRSVVIVATQGHGDEEAVERAVSASPAFVGLVASRKRGEAVLGYLADRGVPRDLLDRVRVPVGLDLGHTTHREIAVAVLAQLVQLRAAGELSPQPAPGGRATPAELAGSAELAGPVDARDPVCGMTVRADPSSRPFEHEGVTYYFCCVGCRDTFARDPHAYRTTQGA
jgi:xanthine dehydrogenase accessory factor